MPLRLIRSSGRRVRHWSASNRPAARGPVVLTQTCQGQLSSHSTGDGTQENNIEEENNKHSVLFKWNILAVSCAGNCLMAGY
jgi:hypothetical protein